MQMKTFSARMTGMKTKTKNVKSSRTKCKTKKKAETNTDKHEAAIDNVIPVLAQ